MGIDRERTAQRLIQADDDEDDQPDEHGEKSRQHDVNAALNLEQVSYTDGQERSDQDDRPHDRGQTTADGV